MTLSGDVDKDHNTSVVYIVDGNINETVTQVAYLMENNAALFGVSSSSWSQQFHSAMAVACEEGEEASSMDYIMHFLTFGWKVVFATVPPTEYGNGWLAFAVALTYIGGLTAVVGEVATIFGCALGLPKAIT